VVSTTQNGSGVAVQSVDIYDSLGNVIWSKDGDGVVTYFQYDPVSWSSDL
jgi:hypothetical protein